jgi:peptide/nickel transport system ATP-binding protein
MAEPILSVRDLKHLVPPGRGRRAPSTAPPSTSSPGKTLGIVGEIGCGKSVTARSILRIVEHPGRVVEGRSCCAPGRRRVIDLVKLDGQGKRMRAIRGGEIGYVFQEPMSSLQPSTPSATSSSRPSACTRT